jgi:hypothetical protein
VLKGAGALKASVRPTVTNGSTNILVEARQLPRLMPAVKGAYLQLMVEIDGAAAVPVPLEWMHLDTSLTKEYKANPYLEASIIVINKSILIPIALMIAYFNGGIPCVKSCFSLPLIKMLMPVAIFQSTADVAEILANGQLDPTMYIICSQSRLLLTALTMKALLGTKQSKPQWIDLIVLTLLICAFQFTPNVFGNNDSGKGGGSNGNLVLGLACTFLKIMCSVFGGVHLQRVVQSAGNTPFAVQLCAMNLTGVTYTAFVLVPVSCTLSGTMGILFERGPFAGPDGYWDYRTVCVLMVYQTREWVTNLVVKRFDALIKNLCNAAATLAAFVFMVWVQHSIPGFWLPSAAINLACVTKLFLIVGVMMLVYNYSEGKLYVKQEFFLK